MPDLYLRLNYREYKKLEEQLAKYEDLETTHTTATGYYHRSFRLELGDLTLEIHGPVVKADERLDILVDEQAR